MNKYNRSAINHFSDIENGKHIINELNNHFRAPSVANYLNNTFYKHHGNYVKALEHQFLSTDMITQAYHGDQNVYSQVSSLNTMFIKYMIKFLHDMFLQTTTHEKLTNRNALAVNDGLNVSAGSLLSGMPRSKLDDRDTSAIDNPSLDYVTNGNAQSLTLHENPSTETRRFRRNLVRRDTDQLVVHGKVRDSADDALQKQWYAHRAPQIRDDPVGELVRDRAAPAFRNQNEFPYGNRTAESMPQLADKFAESTSPNAYNANHPKSPNRHQIANQMASSSHNARSEGLLSRDTIHGGNSLCALEAGNVPIGDNINGGFHPDDQESGTFESKYTGEQADNEYSAVNNLLSTAYIQTLNVERGCNPISDAVQSTAQRAARGPAKKMERDPQNNVKLWQDGDGFVDQSNPAEMQKLLEQRRFRSMNPGQEFPSQAPLDIQACYQCAACLSNKTNLCVNGPTAYGAKHGDLSSEAIPFYERALYVREHDRDAEEALGGFELDGLNRGYGKDMMSLYCRVPTKVPCGKPTLPVRKGYGEGGKAGPSYEETARQEIRVQPPKKQSEGFRFQT